MSEASTHERSRHNIVTELNRNRYTPPKYVLQRGRSSVTSAGDSVVLNCLSFLHLYLLCYGRGFGTLVQADYINFVFKFRSFRYCGDRAGCSGVDIQGE